MYFITDEERSAGTWSDLTTGCVAKLKPKSQVLSADLWSSLTFSCLSRSGLPKCVWYADHFFCVRIKWHLPPTHARPRSVSQRQRSQKVGALWVHHCPGLQGGSKNVLRMHKLWRSVSLVDATQVSFKEVIVHFHHCRSHCSHHRHSHHCWRSPLGTQRPSWMAPGSRRTRTSTASPSSWPGRTWSRTPERHSEARCSYQSWLCLKPFL